MPAPPSDTGPPTREVSIAAESDATAAPSSCALTRRPPTERAQRAASNGHVLDAARQAVLARIPDGSSVMTNTSVTLDQTGIADAINDGGGRWESARNKMFALDFATQAQQMKAIGGQPDYALCSAHAITADGTLVIASASGSQLASYAWGAANVIFVVGAQKLVPSLAAAHQRIYQHSLPLEDARAQATYGQHSQVGKILEIHQELPGRIHIVLIREAVGF